MPVDYISLRQQIKDAAKKAPDEIRRISALRAKAHELLDSNADKQNALREKVELAAKADSFLRCAKPTMENLLSTHRLPSMPTDFTLIAIDGSQINPSRHKAVNFFLINLGAIIFLDGSEEAPTTRTISKLHVSEYTTTGSYSDEQVGLERDKDERILLADLAKEANTTTVVTLTDGPLELWGGSGRESEEQKSHFAKNLRDYLKALEDLHDAGAATAGYVDKPRADLVVRALEVASTPMDELGEIRKKRPLQGVTDSDLYLDLLGPGDRSAIFAIQSQLAPKYAGPLALHFFYLNVGNDASPWLARVEIPNWVVENAALLNALHAILVAQCALLGKLSYPYALHRAHELAVVRREEHDQVTQMLLAEFQARGINLGQPSKKEAAKELPGRRRR